MSTSNLFKDIKTLMILHCKSEHFSKNPLFSFLLTLFLLSFLIFRLTLRFLFFLRLFLLLLLFVMILCFVMEFMIILIWEYFSIFILGMRINNLGWPCRCFKDEVLHVVTNNFESKFFNIYSRIGMEFDFSLIVTSFREYQPSVRVMTKNVLLINVRNKVSWTLMLSHQISESMISKCTKTNKVTFS